MLRKGRSGSVGDVEESIHYSESCPGTKGFRNKRHNDIRDLLSKLIKKRYPLLNFETLKLEEYVGVLEDGTGARADITWHCEAEKVMIDIMCIDVGCLGYVDPPVRSYLTVGKASLVAEAMKRAHYKRVVRPAKLNENSAIPFIVEALL